MAAMATMAPQANRWNGTAATASVGILIGLSFMGSTLITPLYALYRQAFGFSEITLTLIYSIYVVGNLTAVLFFGRLSDRIGRRTVSLPALGLAAGSMLLFLFARGTASLFAARALSGFAIGIATGTGTAWMTDLNAENKTRATVLASASNAIGIAIGPLLAGATAQFVTRPLQIPFIVYLPMLAVCALLIWRTTDTVRPSATGKISFAPKVGVPSEIRAQFAAPAVAAFGTFALIGFYAALIPTVLAADMHERSVLIEGAVVSELFAVTAATIVATRALGSRAAMLGALWSLLPSIALLLLAQSTHSMTLLLVAAGCGGVAAGLGYRGSLQIVNEIAPQNRRAEVVSAYLIACFVGNSVPVVGIGLITAASNSMTASLAFGATIAAFTLAALIFERYRSRSSP